MPTMQVDSITNTAGTGSPAFPNGLTFMAPANLSNADATMLGYKSYNHGTTYNGGFAPTVALSGGGGTLDTVSIARFWPKQMQDGSWVLSGIIAVTLSSASRTNPTFTINGVTFLTGVDQNCVGLATSVAAATYRCTLTNTGISIVYASASTTTHGIAFSNAILDSKPTWAY